MPSFLLISRDFIISIMVLLGTAMLRDRERLLVLRPTQGILVAPTLSAPAEMLDTE